MLAQKTRFTIESLLSLNARDRTAALESLTEAQARELLYDWRFWARDNQLAPEGDWLTWILKAGRGFGKSRTGAETVRQWVEEEGVKRIALVARTPADVRDVMVEGESGIMNISPPWNLPRYEPTKRRLSWPNGAMALAFSSYEPDQLRGPQFERAWCDELGSWKYPRETWDNLQFGLRLGNPKVIVTTTPKPIALLRELLEYSTTVVTSGSSYDNRINLAPAFFDALMQRYEGTRTGRQEIYAEMLDEAEGALWSRRSIDASRVPEPPALSRIVVAIDPAASDTEDSDETGILVAGVGENGHGYVLEDRSGRYSPTGWARAACEAFGAHEANRIIAEANNGGDMVEHTLRTVWPTAPVKLVHASKGKAARAEPVASLYEQGRIHHIGTFPELEDQLVTWEPDSGMRSPDRLDALVWAMTELMPMRPRRPGVYA